MVYSIYDISRQVSFYFGIALLITTVLFLVIIVFFIRHLNRDYVRMRIQDIEIEKEQNFLLLLKKQISAHFTVNTLNVVRALIRRGNKEEAGNTCEGLAFLLRYANDGDETISLGEEIYILERYVKIMQTRYPGKFVFRTDPQGEWEEERIPRMLLQPIVENAIEHGLATGKGTITVAVECGEDIVVTVRDDGCGMEKDETIKIQEKLDRDDYEMDTKLKGMALTNIHKRIRLLYGEGYGIFVRSEKGKGTEVKVRLGRDASM